jgi:NDP-sugar pyrophosphorylase family protein
MRVIILAGGKTNLPGKLENTPKSLIPIKGKPLIEYQLDLLRKYKFNDICLSLYFGADKILEYLKTKDLQADISRKQGKIAGVEYIVGSKALGTGGAIKLAAKNLKKDFMVMNGDVLTNINLNDYVNFYKKNISQPRFFASSQFVKNITPHILPLEVSPFRKRISYEENLGAMAVYYDQNVNGMGLIKTKNEKVVEFLQDPDYQYAGYVNAGFYILSPEVFKIKHLKSKKKTEAFRIEDEVFPELAKSHQLLAYVHRGLWADIGTEYGSEKAETIVEKLNEETK